LLHFDPKVFGGTTRTGVSATMSDEPERPKFREHLQEMGAALGGIGRDVGTSVSDAPHLAKEGAKDAFARAAGIRRKPLKEWSSPETTDPK